MPFGLSGVPGSFQRLMDTLFRDFSFVTTYLDDVLVHSRTTAEHKEHLKAVFSKLKSAGLTLNGCKCTIGMYQVKVMSCLPTAWNLTHQKLQLYATSLHPQIPTTSVVSLDWRHTIDVTYTTLLK